MCFYMQQKDPKPKVEKRFQAKVNQSDFFLQAEVINGFEHKASPIILNSNPQIIETSYSWGLIPHWAKDSEIRDHTLNARIETVTEKPSYKDITTQRCLVIATAFYEWHWNDPKGKSKQKYIIYGEDDLFAIAGFYCHWVDPQTGNLVNTFTILTTQANATMAYIHNHKQRMPIVLKKQDESAWLDSHHPIENFAFPYESKLVAFPV
jgi:putative SOS response-associated peptidase YedK